MLTLPLPQPTGIRLLATPIVDVITHRESPSLNAPTTELIPPEGEYWGILLLATGSLHLPGLNSTLLLWGWGVPEYLASFLATS